MTEIPDQCGMPRPHPSPGRDPDLPPMICFRVTRFCNAKCGFCLAPPDGSGHPATAALKGRIDWLLGHGVKTIFNTRPIPVVEPDGRIILEGATEALDTLLWRIPEVGAVDERESATSQKEPLSSIRG